MEWLIWDLFPPDHYFFEDDTTTTYEMVVGRPFDVLGLGIEGSTKPGRLDRAFKSDGVAGATKFLFQTDAEAMMKIITHPSYADADAKAAMLAGTYTVPEGSGIMSGWKINARRATRDSTREEAEEKLHPLLYASIVVAVAAIVIFFFSSLGA